jgi:hypothetical protein
LIYLLVDACGITERSRCFAARLQSLTEWSTTVIPTPFAIDHIVLICYGDVDRLISDSATWTYIDREVATRLQPKRCIAASPSASSGQLVSAASSSSGADVVSLTDDADDVASLPKDLEAIIASGHDRMHDLLSLHWQSYNLAYNVTATCVALHTCLNRDEVVSQHRCMQCCRQQLVCSVGKVTPTRSELLF